LGRRWTILTGRAVEIDALSRQVARFTTASDAKAAYKRHPGLNASGSTAFVLVTIAFSAILMVDASMN
jgi:hypothetical protein